MEIWSFALGLAVGGGLMLWGNWSAMKAWKRAALEWEQTYRDLKKRENRT